MKRFFLIILATLTVAFVFVSCDGADNVSTEASDDVTTEAPAPEPIVIKLADLEKYEMIRPADSGEALKNAFSSLMSAVRENCGTNVPARDDFYREGVASLKKGEFEILVGLTNRDESIEFLSGLKRDEYGYGVVGSKLVIAGHTEEGTAKAVEEFIAMLGKGDRGEVFFDGKTDAFVKTVSYPCEDVKINGISAFEYTIVCPSTSKNMEKELAVKLRERIADLCGAYPRIADDKSEVTGKMLVIGEASVISDEQKSAYTTAVGSTTDGKYYIFSEGDLLWLNSADAFGFIGAVSEITSKLSENATEISLENGVHTVSASEELSVMSFNLWVSNATAERKKRVIKMINNYTPDIMGVQEASPAWMTYLKENIGNLYSYVGVGRNGGNSGEYSAIFYLKDKFTVVESGTKWLSATPDTANTKFPSSSLPRIMTYAILERKADGMRFLYVNTHLEHTSEQARVEQIEVLVNEIAKLPDLPTIVTGDFNTADSTDTYKVMGKNSFVDAAEVAKNTSDRNTSTFHNYGSSSKRIDFIFASSGDVYIDSYEVCDEKVDGDYVSDHHPIYAEFSIVD